MRNLLLIVMSLIAMVCLADDKEKFMNSYNYVRGIEALAVQERQILKECLANE